MWPFRVVRAIRRNILKSTLKSTTVFLNKLNAWLLSDHCVSLNDHLNVEFVIFHKRSKFKFSTRHFFQKDESILVLEMGLSAFGTGLDVFFKRYVFQGLLAAPSQQVL